MATNAEINKKVIKLESTIETIRRDKQTENEALKDDIHNIRIAIAKLPSDETLKGLIDEIKSVITDPEKGMIVKVAEMSITLNSIQEDLKKFELKLEKNTEELTKMKEFKTVVVRILWTIGGTVAALAAKAVAGLLKLI